jgi:hypothetical protein
VAENRVLGRLRKTVGACIDPGLHDELSGVRNLNVTSSSIVPQFMRKENGTFHGGLPRHVIYTIGSTTA